MESAVYMLFTRYTSQLVNKNRPCALSMELSLYVIPLGIAHESFLRWRKNMSQSAAGGHFL